MKTTKCPKCNTSSFYYLTDMYDNKKMSIDIDRYCKKCEERIDSVIINEKELHYIGLEKLFNLFNNPL